MKKKAKKRQRKIEPSRCFWCEDGFIIAEYCNSCHADYSFKLRKRPGIAYQLPQVKEVLITGIAKDKRK
jgi:hypothetical protein